MTEIKILTLEEWQDILDFEKAQQVGSDFEKEMSSWHARWRRESLEHYLPQGWSFVKRESKDVGGKIRAYILCQPLLFFEGWTQSLWIEHVSALTNTDGAEMIEIAYRWARDKHLQKVFFNTQLKYIREAQFAPQQTPVHLGHFSSTKI